MNKKILNRRRSRRQSLTAPSRRDRRINIRASAEQETLIREAAELRRENLTDFMLRSACREAEISLSEKRNYVLAPEKWEAFLGALDRPTVEKPRLRKLFMDPSVLEQ